MIETIVKVDGMMCTAYALDLIAGCIDGIPQLLLVQRLFRVDHRLGFCLRGRHPFHLREGLAHGYEVKGVSSAPYEKKGFFSFLKK